MTRPRLGLSAPRPVRAPTLLCSPSPSPPLLFPPTHILNTLRSKSAASFHPSSSLARKERGEGEEEQSAMIQSPGGGSACHGVSLFIWSEYELKNDCAAKKEEIKNTGKECGGSCCLHPPLCCHFGRQTHFRRVWRWLHWWKKKRKKRCEITKYDQKVTSKQTFCLNTLVFLLFFFTFWCHMRPQLVCTDSACVCVCACACVCRTKAGVFAQAPS